MAAGLETDGVDPAVHVGHPEELFDLVFRIAQTDVDGLAPEARDRRPGFLVSTDPEKPCPPNQSELTAYKESDVSVGRRQDVVRWGRSGCSGTRGSSTPRLGGGGCFVQNCYLSNVPAKYPEPPACAHP